MLERHVLQDLLEPVIGGLGYEIVRIASINQNRPTLQIMIERIDRADITVDDCAKVSKAVSAVLDEKDPIDGEYNLEVSSPGLDRPLTKLENFERFAGYEAKIETTAAIENRKRFKGKLLGIEGQKVLITMEDVTYAIAFADIAKAKLVLTDELLASAKACDNNEE